MWVDNAPPPNTYDLISQFGKKCPTKAFSFGISRDAYTKVYQKGNTSPDKQVPGPGTYQIKNTIGGGRKYSMRPKALRDCKAHLNLRI